MNPLQERIVYRNYKFRMLPTKGQHARLACILESQRQLYNAALEERIGCYEKTGAGLSYMDQTKSLTLLRKHQEFSSVPMNLQRWTLKRLDEAYKGFYKRGGYPRFKGRGRFSAFGFSEFCGFKLVKNRMFFKSMPGSLRIHMHRPLRGVIKSCVVGKDNKGWFVCFQCAIPSADAEHKDKSIGLDVGISSFATLSTGEAIPNPKAARKHEKETRRRSRALARCKRGSNRRKKVKKRLSITHDKIRNTRRTHAHQISARLAREYSLIAVEDLKIKNMVKNRNLARSINDAGWGFFIDMLVYKAEEAGGQVIKVNPRNTSQACSGCGQIVPKGLSERTHSCDCGLSLDRDHNAALNILSLAVAGQNEANVGNCAKRPHGNITLEAA